MRVRNNFLLCTMYLFSKEYIHTGNVLHMLNSSEHL